MTHPQKLNDELPNPPSPESGMRVQIEQSENLTKLLDQFGALHDAIMQNGTVTKSHIPDVQSAIRDMSVILEGRTIALNDEELKKNAKIWKEILNGNTENHSELTLLPPAVALAIAKNEEVLNIELPLLTRLSDEVIAGLMHGSRFKYIKLNGVTSISAKQFVALRKGEKSLEMNGLSSLPAFTEEDVRTLMSAPASNRKILRLSGIRSVTSAELETLLNIARGDLVLDRLHELPELKDNVQTALKNHDYHLSLSGLPSITDEEFRQLLSKKKNTIRLDGIKTLPPLSKETEDALTQRGWGCLSFGLENISDAEFGTLLLSQVNTLSLRSLKRLPDFSEQTIGRILLHKGGLDFNSIHTITDKQLEALLKDGGFTVLDGLTSLPEFSNATIQALRQYRYKLGLRQLASISDHNARACAEYNLGNSLLLPSHIEATVKNFKT